MHHVSVFIQMLIVPTNLGQITEIAVKNHSLNKHKWHGTAIPEFIFKEFWMFKKRESFLVAMGEKKLFLEVKTVF